ncbi:MAG: tRNA pseudouridine(55) synthase TruB [Planctomycetaceae bacterium]
MFGLLNIDKPAGFSSRDVVNKVQRLARPAKVGHAGTLDPIATGVLIVCVGPATRLETFIHRFPKTYEGEFLIGCTSPTDDTESEPEPLDGAAPLDEVMVRAALQRFTGRIEQVPPAFSAVKIAGRPAYKIARKGTDVDIPPREVEIHALELLELTSERMRLRVECGSGTYVRSLGRDLAAALGSGAVMCGLRRSRIGPFTVEDAIDFAAIRSDSLADLLLPAQRALPGWPEVTLDDLELALIRNGRQVETGERVASAEVAVLSQTGQLAALAERNAAGTLQPRLVFRE